jgi:hypothetical protein
LTRQTISLEGWWNAAVSNKSKDEARLTAAMLIYTAWNLWKERNRRVFEGVSEKSNKALSPETGSTRHTPNASPKREYSA